MVFPYVTALFAALLGLIGAALTVNVIRNRTRLNVDIGDGGIPAMTSAIRAHGNFAEQTPIAILLIGIVEALGWRSWIVWTLASVFLLARLLSAYGLLTSLSQLSPTRRAGAGLTNLLAAIASVLILITAFTMMGGMR